MFYTDGNMFLTMNLKALNIIELLSSNPNNLQISLKPCLLKIFQLILQLIFYFIFNVSMYFIYSFSFIKSFFIRINFNKFIVKLLFYCFLSLYFIINISIILSKFINFYCKLVIVKTKINSVSQDTVFTLHIFSLKYFFY